MLECMLCFVGYSPCKMLVANTHHALHPETCTQRMSFPCRSLTAGEGWQEKITVNLLRAACALRAGNTSNTRSAGSRALSVAHSKQGGKQLVTAALNILAPAFLALGDFTAVKQTTDSGVTISSMLGKTRFGHSSGGLIQARKHDAGAADNYDKYLITNTPNWADSSDSMSLQITKGVVDQIGCWLMQSCDMAHVPLWPHTVVGDGHAVTSARICQLRLWQLQPEGISDDSVHKVTESINRRLSKAQAAVAVLRAAADYAATVRWGLPAAVQ